MIQPAGPLRPIAAVISLAVVLAVGLAFGEHRAVEAAQQAIASPLLEETSIDGARGLLINITGGEDVTLNEVNEAAEIITEGSDPEAQILFGAVVDPARGDELQVTVIATGFETVRPTRRQLLEQHYGQHRQQPVPAPAPEPATVSVEQDQAPQQQPSPKQKPISPRYTPNNIEIPAFLRRK